MSALKYAIPTLSQLQKRVEDTFGVKPCLFQARDSLAQLRGQDCITIARTGSGKTLTFWIPLLFNNGGVIIIVTALNLLGDQNVEELERKGIRGINITAETATDQAFKDIAEGHYNVIIVSPEKIISDTRFKKLWENKTFTKKLFNISFDEAHCISQWGAEFRPAYAQLGRLRWILPPHVRFHAVSATLPPAVLKDVQEKLNIKPSNVTIIRTSNDRPNIHLMVEEMKYTADSMQDIERILRTRMSGPENRPPKFMIFANKRRETELGVEKMWKNLSQDLRDKIVWFHSGMSPYFRAEAIEKLRTGELWGFWCTDAAGMGLDLPDIELVIQWRYTSSLCMLMQRFGRGARQPGTEATGIYLVEPQYFDHAANKVLQSKKRTRKATASRRPTKRSRTDNNSNTVAGGDSSTGDANSGEVEAEENPNANIVDLPESSTTTATTVESNVPMAAIGILSSTNPPPTSAAPISHLPSLMEVGEEQYELDAMDAFINARSRGICRRDIVNEYFDNFNTDLEKGCCSRCGGGDQKTRLCCDSCSPDSFVLLPLSQPLDKATTKRKTNFKDFKMDDHDFSVRDALRKWRTDQLVKEGKNPKGFFGANLILSDEILIRIVMLARVGKIANLDELSQQTDWVHARKYGSEVLRTIAALSPLPASSDEPAAESAIPGDAPGASDRGTALATALTGSVPKRAQKCSGCGSERHISSNSLCPAKVAGKRSDSTSNDKENNVPSLPGSTQRKCGRCNVVGHTARSRTCPYYGQQENQS